MINDPYDSLFKIHHSSLITIRFRSEVESVFLLPAICIRNHYPIPQQF